VVVLRGRSDDDRTTRAIAAKAARTVANGMRPPTLLSSISLIARLDSNVSEVRWKRLFRRTCGGRWRKNLAWLARSDVFCAVYTPSTTLTPLFLHHLDFFGDLNGSTGIPHRGTFRAVSGDTVMPRLWTRGDPVGCSWIVQSSDDIFSATGAHYY
jgi:hypothetical protein